MPRLDRRYNGFDVIRIVDKNLDVNSKRLVFAYFFSTLPLKEPKVDVLQFILDVAGLIPVAGTAAKVFELSLATAQVIKDIAELFGLEFEDLEVELARVKKELETTEEEIKRQREEIVELQLETDRLNERISALLATQELLEDEINNLLRQVQNVRQELRPQVRRLTGSIRRRGNRILELLPGVQPGQARGVTRVQATLIVREAKEIEGLV